MTFRTRLREAARGPLNFAGGYMLALWGCGTSCTSGAVISAQTGRVIWLPASICCEDAGTGSSYPERVQYRADSQLLILTGLRNEREDDQGAHYYRIEGGHFVHLLDVPAPPRR